MFNGGNLATKLDFRLETLFGQSVKTYMNTNLIIRLLVAAACIYLLEVSGFWVWLVAHPFWSFKGVLIGIAAGIGILLVAKLIFRNKTGNRTLTVGLLLLAVIIAAAGTFYGKSGFAASFGENRTAGVFWYYGYLALTTASFMTIFELSGYIFGQKSR